MSLPDPDLSAVVHYLLPTNLSDGLMLIIVNQRYSFVNSQISKRKKRCPFGAKWLRKCDLRPDERRPDNDRNRPRKDRTGDNNRVRE